jgi:hypothetical protein
MPHNNEEPAAVNRGLQCGDAQRLGGTIGRTKDSSPTLIEQARAWEVAARSHYRRGLAFSGVAGGQELALANWLGARCRQAFAEGRRHG